MDIMAEKFDLAAALKADEDGSTLRSLKDSLAALQARLRRTMDKGLPQKDFDVANNLHRACIISQDLLEQFWSQPRK
ncbi:MAG: hypothetical protein LBO77_06345 [Desulfovibrio sp.]|jgi:hypothetical protein|nr:hypothetical protein [Desulfovibrio sp.]